MRPPPPQAGNAPAGTRERSTAHDPRGPASHVHPPTPKPPVEPPAPPRAPAASPPPLPLEIATGVAEIDKLTAEMQRPGRWFRGMQAAIALSSGLTYMYVLRGSRILPEQWREVGLPKEWSSTLSDSINSFVQHTNWALAGLGILGSIAGYCVSASAERALYSEVDSRTRQNRTGWQILKAELALLCGVTYAGIGLWAGVKFELADFSLPDSVSGALTQLAMWQIHTEPLVGWVVGLSMGVLVALQAERDRSSSSTLQKDEAAPKPRPEKTRALTPDIAKQRITDLTEENRGQFNDIQSAFHFLTAGDSAPQYLETLCDLRNYLEATAPAPVTLPDTSWTATNAAELLTAVRGKVIETSRAALLAFASPAAGEPAVPRAPLTREDVYQLSRAVEELGKSTQESMAEGATGSTMIANAADAPALQQAIARILDGWEIPSPSGITVPAITLSNVIELWNKVAPRYRIVDGLVARPTVDPAAISPAGEPPAELSFAPVMARALQGDSDMFDAVTAGLPPERAAEFHVHFSAELLEELGTASEAARREHSTTALLATKLAMQHRMGKEAAPEVTYPYSNTRNALLDITRPSEGSAPPNFINRAITGLRSLLLLPVTSFETREATNALEMAVELVGWGFTSRTANITDPIKQLRPEQQFLWPILATATDNTGLLPDAKKAINTAINVAVAAAANKIIDEEINPRLYKSGTTEAKDLSEDEAGSILGLIRQVEELTELNVEEIVTGTAGTTIPTRYLLANGRRKAIVEELPRLKAAVKEGRKWETEPALEIDDPEEQAQVDLDGGLEVLADLDIDVVVNGYSNGH
ncbi:MAG: hypothetical protein WC901_01275 [Candidatus Margulisiibacteriota bacterium]